MRGTKPNREHFRKELWNDQRPEMKRHMNSERTKYWSNLSLWAQVEATDKPVPSPHAPGARFGHMESMGAQCEHQGIIWKITCRVREALQQIFGWQNIFLTEGKARNDKELLSTIYDQTLHRVEQKWVMWYREPLAICCFLYSMNNFRKGTDCNFSHLQISSDCKGLVWWTPIHYYCAYSFVFFPFKKKKKKNTQNQALTSL